MQQLVSRYQTSVQGAAMTAAYTPVGSGMLGHVMASFTTSLLFSPKSGEMTGDDAEARLSRAALNLENGDLRKAVSELSQIDGLPAEAVSDWMAEAKNRLLVDQAIQLVDTQCICLAQSFA
jgi:mitofilin